MGPLDFSQMERQELFELALKGDTQQLVVRIKQDNRYVKGILMFNHHVCATESSVQAYQCSR